MTSILRPAFLGLLFFTAAPASAIPTLESALDSIISQASKKLPADTPILVLGLQDIQGKSSHLGVYVAEQIKHGLANTSSHLIVERATMDTLLSERRWAEIGLLDEKTAIQVGKSAGAKAVIFGTLTELDKKIVLNLKIADIESGILLGGVKQNVKKTPDVVRLIEPILIGETKNENDSEKERPIESTVGGIGVKTFWLTEESLQPIPIKDVVFSGVWEPNTFRHNNPIDVASFTLFFDDNSIGQDWSAVTTLARRQSARLGCNSLYYVSEDEMASNQRTVTYHCLRSRSYEQDKIREKWERDLRKFDFGIRWLEFKKGGFKFKHNEFLQSAGIKIARGKSRAYYVSKKDGRRISDFELVELTKSYWNEQFNHFVEENKKEYISQVNKIREIQKRYEGSLVFPEVDQNNKPNGKEFFGKLLRGNADGLHADELSSNEKEWIRILSLFLEE